MPGVRGVVRLGEALAVIPLVKRALPRGAAAVPGRLACSAVAAGASLTGALLRRRAAGRSAARSAAALLSVAPALFALRGGELAAYHGVEHKAIAAYEQDADDARRRRQGARPLRLAPRHAAAGLQPGGHAAAAPGRSSGPGRWPAPRVALASTAAAVEVFAWCERNSETPLARALRRPGFEIQRLIGTREPDERQLEVGRAALAEILRVEAHRTTRVHAALWCGRRLR